MQTSEILLLLLLLLLVVVLLLLLLATQCSSPRARVTAALPGGPGLPVNAAAAAAPGGETEGGRESDRERERGGG